MMILTDLLLTKFKTDRLSLPLLVQQNLIEVFRRVTSYLSLLKITGITELIISFLCYTGLSASGSVHAHIKMGVL